MGDFNDNPDANSVKLLQKDGGLYSEFKGLWSPTTGTACYRGVWSLFDQILVSKNMKANDAAVQLISSRIFKPSFCKLGKHISKGIRSEPIRVKDI